MGILDEAIREHLELKRQHGAGESELKQLEDEAFGPPERPGGESAPPDQFAEAPTEFMAQPGAEEGDDGAPDTGPSLRQRAASRVAELQEPPQPPQPTEPAEEEPPPPEEALAEDAAPELQQEEEPSAEQEQPVAEHEAVEAPAEEGAGPSTAEREAISEQPTEYFDVERELAEAERRGPSEEDLVDEGVSEPRLAPVDPLAGLEESDEIAASGPGEEGEIAASTGAEAEEDSSFEEEDDEFFDEKRLSDELDEALEAPLDSAEGEMVEVEEAGESSLEAEESVETAPPEPSEEEPAEEEHAPEQASVEGSDQDVLEATPDFLEEAPEDDELWFEQKPPKDFDFDD